MQERVNELSRWVANRMCETPSRTYGDTNKFQMVTIHWHALLFSYVCWCMITSMTPLALLCEKILEAGWLAALIIAPLYFNVYSSRVFEPDKITLIRSIALVMAAAWLVKKTEQVFERSARSTARRANPLVLPALIVAVVYIIATIFSVAPEISFWGSYQRLQGTFTTLSYIVIFFIAASTLCTRAQFERAVNTALLVSLPIALYGLLQHFQLDPLPWGGDVIQRVASNMGNSIFVAAYMIMLVPLAVVRWLESLARLEGTNRRVIYIGAGVILVALTAAWAFQFTLGAGFALWLFYLACLYALLTRTRLRDALSVAVYTIILAAQFVAIFFTQSRGPWLGLVAALFAFVLLSALARGARRIALGVLALALIGVAFLAVFNLPNSPLEPLKRVPYIGRLGQLLETEGGTGKVRELIWQGAVQMIMPHAPLWSPTTGDDAFNAIRPLVGYGPEAMYVAYNPFYPPDLAHYESRTASPDRSHNETFDTLVTTGVLGFAAYIFLFLSVFYYALKWLGILRTRREQIAFIALWFVLGGAAALGMGMWRGWNFIGVALPVGMIGGLFVFLALRVILPREAGESMSGGDALWIAALASAIIGHLIEINFGIAIVSTRTYFWLYAALLIFFGWRRLRAADSSNRPNEEDANGPILPWAFIITIVLVTLSFDFVNNQAGLSNALEAMRRSLFTVNNADSPAVFFMFVLTWVAAGIIGIANQERVQGKAFVKFALVSLAGLSLFVILQMGLLTALANLTDAFVYLLAFFYLVLFFFILCIAIALWINAPPGETSTMSGAAMGVVLTVILAVVIVLVIYATNFAVVAADIYFKGGSERENGGDLNGGIAIYRRAFEFQPNQDYYALFLGRAYLEIAQPDQDANRRMQSFTSSEQTLLHALRINPLNTDHTANLARLSRNLAAQATVPADKTARLQKANEYYETATRLSPNSANLYNEWSQVYSQSGDLIKAHEKLVRSLELDPQFAQTYLYLGQTDQALGDNARALESYLHAIALDPAALSGNVNLPLTDPILLLSQPEFAPRAIEAYRAALANAAKSVAGHIALGELYQSSGQNDLAQSEFQRAVESAPKDYTAHLVFVNFNSESGQIDAAIVSMRHVLDLYPDTKSEVYKRFQDFYNQLQTVQRAIQAAQKSPNDVAAHRILAAMWKARGQPRFALPEYETVARLASNDYDARKNIALLNLQMGNWDAAGSAFQAATALAPEIERVLWRNVQSAFEYQSARQMDRAVASAEGALAVAGDNDKPAVQGYIEKLKLMK